jgi:hypothetical protein
MGSTSLARFEAGATIRTETRDKLERALAAAGAAFSAKAGRLGVTVPE